MLLFPLLICLIIIIMCSPTNIFFLFSREIISINLIVIFVRMVPFDTIVHAFLQTKLLWESQFFLYFTIIYLFTFSTLVSSRLKVDLRAFIPYRKHTCTSLNSLSIELIVLLFCMVYIYPLWHINIACHLMFYFLATSSILERTDTVKCRRTCVRHVSDMDTPVKLLHWCPRSVWFLP
jgi:hypothetical protein